MPTPMIRIESWFATNLPEFLDDLAPGCSEAALADTEALIGTELPEDFKDLYRRHDGQLLRRCWGIFYDLHFISLSKVREEWWGWKEAMPSGLDNSPFSESAPPGAVRNVYASRGWIAFAIDSGGNSIGIDLDPGPRGTRGQVINFGRDEYEKFVLARSTSEFLEWFAGQLESGNFLTRNTPGLRAMRDSGLITLGPGPFATSVPEPMWRSLHMKNPPDYNLLDALRHVFAWQRAR